MLDSSMITLMEYRNSGFHVSEFDGHKMLDLREKLFAPGQCLLVTFLETLS